MFSFCAKLAQILFRPFADALREAGRRPDADAEIIALAAEIDRLLARRDEIYAERIAPFDETFRDLLDDAVVTMDQDRTKWNQAWEYSRSTGREAAAKEVEASICKPMVFGGG